MKPINKEFLRRIFGFLGLYLIGAVLGSAVLTKDSAVIFLFLSLCLPFIILVSFSRFNVNVYLITSTYLFALGFVCLLSAVVFTLLPPKNAMHYYGLSAPDNYIALAFCTLPFVALFIYMLNHGCKNLDEITIPFIQTCKKINLDTKEYYMNQKVNVLRDATKKNPFLDSKLENFLERHAGLVYRVIMFTSGLGPVIPILISRNAGQQPVNVYFLICVSYLAWCCAYFLPIAIQMTRTVMYIQKKHNIKLKLAYKKDVIMV